MSSRSSPAKSSGRQAAKQVLQGPKQLEWSLWGYCALGSSNKPSLVPRHVILSTVLLNTSWWCARFQGLRSVCVADSTLHRPRLILIVPKVLFRRCCATASASQLPSASYSFLLRLVGLLADQPGCHVSRLTCCLMRYYTIMC